MNKREFIGALTLAGLAGKAGGKEILNQLERGFGLSADTQNGEDDFWNAMRQAYTLPTEYINLENGYYAMMPKPILEGYIGEIKKLNASASFYMRTHLQEDKIRVRKQLADFLKCSVDEMVITRNTTESIDTILSGIDWKAGDEAIMAYQDYGSMLDMFRQLSARYQIVNKMVSVPTHPQSDEEIVALYEKQITPRTRLIMLSHIINISGQILPVKKICEMAHQRGVEVLVDGAHALAQIDFSIPELGCDYYASSLHKWLSVPLGAGLLYVRKEKIAGIWPLFAEGNYATDDIRKLNHTGTHPMATELSILYAIQFHQSIGSGRKEQRLRYLQHYWTSRVRDIEGIQVHTPADPKRSCAIANVGLKNKKPADMAKILMDKYKIWTVAIDNEKAGIQGCRITPSVYTQTRELDQLILALEEMK